jgi:hypothetical protein
MSTPIRSPLNQHPDSWLTLHGIGHQFVSFVGNHLNGVTAAKTIVDA